VKDQLISEVPLGAFLSGGLDSSFVIGIMNRVGKKNIKTFSIGFDDLKYDETKYSNIIANYFQTDHTKIITNPESFDLLKKIIWHLDEPVADPACIPTYLMSKEAKKQVSIVLTGEGGDEILAGYKKYKLFVYSNILKKIIPKIFVKLLNDCFRGKNKYFKALKIFFYSKSKAETILNMGSVFSIKEKELLYSNDLKEKVDISKNKNSILKDIESYFQNNYPYLNQLLFIDFKTWLVNDPLLKVDKMTMAHGLEGRVPLLDKNVIEFTQQLPVGLKLRNFTEKYLLRKAMKGIVPEAIIKRRKKTFDVPVKMFLGEGRKILSRENVEKRGLFNYDYIISLFDKDLDNQGYRAQFWTLLCLELWFQIFID